MKDNEKIYLDRLFSSSLNKAGDAEVEIPLVPVPEGLSGKLNAIAEMSDGSSKNELASKRGFLISWPQVTGVAASLLVALMGFQFYQQQQTLKQLEQAQSDLATALHYLGEANRITQEQVLNSLNENIQKTDLVPAMEARSGDVKPKRRYVDTKILNRTL